MASCIARGRDRMRGGPVTFLAVVTMVVVVGAAGCSDGPDQPFEWPDDPTSGPVSTVDPAEAAAIEEILATFDGFRRAEVAVQADPEPAYLALEQLADYLADPLLGSVLFDVDTMHRRGVVRAGEPTWRPEVTGLRLDGSPPTATVRDCLDTTGWRLADRQGGQATAESVGLPVQFEPDRYVMEFSARRFDDRWLLDEAKVERGERC